MSTHVVVKSRDEIAKAYESPPFWYDLRGLFILTFAYRSTLWQQVRFFGRNIGARHLEVAIGTGSLFDLVLRWRRWKKLPRSRVLGIDYAESMLQGARVRFLDDEDVALEHGDATAMPYADNTFDSVNIANAVHCFPDVDAGLRESLRVLKPTGRLAINVLLYPKGMGLLDRIAHRINAFGIRKGILVSPHDREEFRERLQAAGAELIEEQTSGNTYNVLVGKKALNR